MRDFPGHLPIQLNSFVGREGEVAELARLLAAARGEQDPACPASRLITLTGPAGVGKTRLALQVAAGAQDTFAHGSCFVPLAGIRDPALVIPSMLERLDFKETRGRPPQAKLRRVLQSRQMLIILDNFEQVIPAASHLGELLAACPRLVLLVTSREVLRVQGEHVYGVGPLPVPDARESSTVASIRRYAGILLFAERAQAANPTFQITRENAEAVAEICCQLEGLPLAIELAAARARVLSASQIASRLADRFSLLVRTGETGPTARHQTLYAAISWSYDLLSPDEQTLLRRLATFAGGFTLEAVEAICALRACLDLLTRLADKSLIQVEQSSPQDAARYSMLDMVRDFACAKLDQSGEMDETGRRHMAFFVQLAEQAEPQLRGPDQMVWAAGLEREQDNFWAAAMWSRSYEPDGQGALRLAAALAWLWRLLRGNPTEWIGWCTEILVAQAGHGQAAVRARALLGVGMVSLLQGDYATAQSMAEESVTLWETLNKPGDLAHGLNLLALAYHALGRSDEASRLYQRSLTIRSELGDRWGIAQTLTNIAMLAAARGDIAHASALYEESLATARSAGDGRLIGFILIGLASAFAKTGDCARAVALYRESLQIAEANGDQWLAPLALEGLATVIATQPDGPNSQQLAEATRLWGAAEALRDAIAAAMWPADRAEHDALVSVARSQLEETLFAGEWAIGRSMSLGESQQFALHGLKFTCGGSPAPLVKAKQPARPSTRRRANKAQYGGLTEREREVAALIAQGKSNRAIADSLVITERTVSTHVSNILSKLHLTSRTQIAAWAVEKGLPKTH
jgi:non-specific serine/threonine protein kinase